MTFCIRGAAAMKILAAVLLSALLFSVAWAEEEAPQPADESDETLEPEVTIRQSGDRTIHEYRINGQIYMIKIVPRKGPPYYLMDLDGDGEMDVTEEDPSKIVVPQWILFRW